MTETVAHMDDQSVAALTLLANSEIGHITAPSCSVHVGSTLLHLGAISIPLGTGGIFRLSMTMHEFGTDNYYAELTARADPVGDSIPIANKEPVEIRLLPWGRSSSGNFQRVDSVSVFTRYAADHDEEDQDTHKSQTPPDEAISRRTVA